MRAHLVGITETLRLFTQLPLEARQPSFPMPPVGLPLAPFLGHEIEGKLVRVKILSRLGDPRSLLFEELGQRSRFLLAALHELCS